jgi:hypothetical protein
MEPNPAIDALIVELYGGARKKIRKNMRPDLKNMTRDEWNAYQRERYRVRILEHPDNKRKQKSFATNEEKAAYQREQYKKRKEMEGKVVRKYMKKKKTTEEDDDIALLEQIVEQTPPASPTIPDEDLYNLMEQLDQERVQEEGMYNNALPPRTGILEFSDLF